ncbi:MAG: hypothetical protein HND56_01120 [Pseudomonadota bacterium]|nr:hypothetical protein [Pseudomonadota bacterium]QKK04367.1 MAG: hypothetical protein HND56_01120 [Pseudomonadota bacterium]
MTDARKAARFCLGALGWTPQVFRCEAVLQDIIDALEGYALYRLGTDTAEMRLPPSAAFLNEMTAQFPD